MATFIGNIGVPRIDRHIKFDPSGYNGVWYDVNGNRHTGSYGVSSLGGSFHTA